MGGSQKIGSDSIVDSVYESPGAQITVLTVIECISADGMLLILEGIYPRRSLFR